MLLSALCYIRINGTTNTYMKDDREIMFHGVNAIYKNAPYFCNTTEFNCDTSLVEEDAEIIKKLGYNVVRVGVEWPGVYVTQNQINYTYLNIVQDTINMLGRHGIYSVLDLHQDLMTQWNCGNGAPYWLFNYEREGIKPFPEPIGEAFERYDNGTLVEDQCGKYSWAFYYMTDYVGDVFDCFYNKSCNHYQAYNSDEPADIEVYPYLEFIKLWKTLATHFKYNEYIIGYELLNEPISGSLMHHPQSYLKSAQYEREVMQPFYQDLMSAIYDIDKNHIIMFEPVVTSIQPAGFDVNGPGAAIGIPREKQSYAWHLYCYTIDENGDPMNRILCNAQEKFWYEQRNASSASMNLANMITEFGNAPNDDISRDALEYQLDMFSTDAHSWIYWIYKDDKLGLFNRWDGCTIQDEKVKLLTYPFVPELYGHVLTSKFNFKRNRLEYKYVTGKIGGFSPITINYLWEGFGTKAEVKTGAGACEFVQQDGQVGFLNKVEGQECEIWVS